MGGARTSGLLTIAQALVSPRWLHESVNEEFSFVRTVRHLVFAMEKWFNVPILGESFHAMGLPNSGSVDFPWPGLDYYLPPSVSPWPFARIRPRFRDYLAIVAAADFLRPIDVLENGKDPLPACI